MSGYLGLGWSSRSRFISRCLVLGWRVTNLFRRGFLEGPGAMPAGYGMWGTIDLPDIFLTVGILHRLDLGDVGGTIFVYIRVHFID